MHWTRKWQPTPVFLPGESQGRGNLVGCHLWGRTESDTTEATEQQQQQQHYQKTLVESGIDFWLKKEEKYFFCSFFLATSGLLYLKVIYRKKLLEDNDIVWPAASISRQYWSKTQYQWQFLLLQIHRFNFKVTLYFLSISNFSQWPKA